METLYRLSYWGVLGRPSADRLHGGRCPGEIGPSRQKSDSWPTLAGRWAVATRFLSVASRGRVLSVLSVLSVGSVGSAGSLLSVGSAASVLSVGSFASAASLLSAASAGSVMSWASAGAVMGRPTGRTGLLARVIAVGTVVAVLGARRSTNGSPQDTAE